MSIGALSSHREDFVLVHQIELKRFVAVRVVVRVGGPNVAAAQES